MGDVARRRKDYKPASGGERVVPMRNEPPGYAFHANGLEIDLSRYRLTKGKGDIAWNFAVAIWRRRIAFRAATLGAYVVAIDRFFEFIRARHPKVVRVSEITTDVLVDFNYWAQRLAQRRRGGKPLAEGTPLRWWKSLAAVLTELLHDDDSKLPRELIIPWGVTRGHVDSQTKPYTVKERDQIVRACHRAIESTRNEVDAVGCENLKGSGMIRLIPYLLLLALRTGFNAGVLLGLEIGCVVSSNISGLGWVRGGIKFRSGVTPNHPVKPAPDLSTLPLSLREAELIAEVEKLTGPVRQEAAESDQRLLWLVRSRGTGTARRAIPLGETSYFQPLRAFAERYDLRDDEGGRLVLNLRRCRPSFAEGLLKANGGDIIELKKRLTHKSLRATMRYIDPDAKERKHAFRFAGFAMQAWALGEGSLPDRQALARDLHLGPDEVDRLLSGERNMRVAKCKNPWNSPVKGVKPGEACSEFMVCLRCPNVVILREDAHRLFSFYWFIRAKQYRIDRKRWEAGYRWILKVIDDEIAPRLADAQWIEQVKMTAKANPHPLWEIDDDWESAT